jgi:hypothetical protein
LSSGPVVAAAAQGVNECFADFFPFFSPHCQGCDQMSDTKESFEISGKTVRVRAFKNRHMSACTLTQVNSVLKGQSWCHYQGIAKRCDSKFESNHSGYHCYQVDCKMDVLNNIFPCASLVTVEFEGKLAAFANIEYPSVSVDLPAKTSGELVELRMASQLSAEKIRQNLSSIPTGVTRTLELPKKKLTIVMDLGFDGPTDEFFNPVVQKDDITGLAYPYRLLKLTILQKQ